jgi:hypothetical protein
MILNFFAEQVLGLPLLAQASPYKHLGDSFTEDAAGFDWYQALMATMLVISILALAYFINRYFLFFERRSHNSKSRLFHDLCLAHKLDSPGCQLLRSLAKAHDTHPSTLFLAPEKFESCPELANFSTTKRAELISLRDRLFGTRLFDPPAEELVEEAV